MTFAGLARLLAGGAHVVQHPVSFVRMLVRIRRFFAGVESLVELHAQVIVLVELDSDTIDVTRGFRRARRRTVRAAVAASELIVPATSHGIHELLEPGFPEEQLNSSGQGTGYI